MAQIVENLEVENLTMEEAKVSLGNYDFAIVHMISQMQYGEMDSILKSYLMRNGKKLVVKEYLQPDEDGQAVVKYTRPLSMK